MHTFRHLPWIVPLALLAGSAAAADPPPAAAEAVLAIEHVTILPMTRPRAELRNATVLIEGGRIKSVGSARTLRIPAGARRVDGRGKFLLPAFADMHVHIESNDAVRQPGGGAAAGTYDTQDLLIPYVAYGVLQVFNLSATPDALRQRADVESGRLLGPHMALGYLVDGNPPVRPASHIAATPADGVRMVREIAAGGYDAVKTYSNLDEATFLAIVAEARNRGLKAVGHLPLRHQDAPARLLVPGFSMVVHAEELFFQASADPEAQIPTYIDLMKRTGTWLATTVRLNERIVDLTISLDSLKTRPEMRYVHPATLSRWINSNPYAGTKDRLERRKRQVEFHRKLMPALARAGVPFVVGTDSLVPGIVAGFALHDELQALVDYGVPAESVLLAATRYPAQYLGVLADRGTVEASKQADLVLLDADPRVDIANTRRIAAVIAAGRYLGRAQLDAMMEQLATRYAAMPTPVPAAKPQSMHFEDCLAH